MLMEMSTILDIKKNTLIYKKLDINAFLKNSIKKMFIYNK